MKKPWENLNIDDQIRLVDIYPEKNKSRWIDLFLWNLSDESFMQEKQVKTWITIILKEAIEEQFIKRIYDFFWEKIILESLDFYLKKWKIKQKTIDLTKQILENLKNRENV